MSSVDAVSLLRGLGGLRPGEVGGGGAPRASSGAGSFDDLLSKAQAGELTTGRPVTVDRALGLELGEAELGALSAAADAAEAAGATRAAVVLGERVYTVDLSSRKVTACGPCSEVVTGVDATVVVPSGDGGGAGAAGAVVTDESGAVRGGAPHPALARLLRAA